MALTMYDTQIGGSHYASKTIQPLEVMRSWMTPEQFKGYLRGNIIKYSCRCDDKGGSVDIRKLIQYAEVLAEVMEQEESSASKPRRR
jgi:hypothetical protein